MHTIQRKVVIYTTLRIVGYLLLWKYSCFIFGTENSCTNVFRVIWPLGKILQLLVAACTVVSKLKTERKTLHISWCIIRTRGTCVARAGKSTLSALRAKRVNLFQKIRAPASFLFLAFPFLILRQRKRANSKKYFTVYSNKYPNFSTVQLPALASKSFASESSEAFDTL